MREDTGGVPSELVKTRGAEAEPAGAHPRHGTVQLDEGLSDEMKGSPAFRIHDASVQ